MLQLDKILVFHLFCFQINVQLHLVTCATIITQNKQVVDRKVIKNSCREQRKHKLLFNMIVFRIKY